MLINEAIKLAQTEHVVYFLLTAYVETLGHADNYGIPEKVRRLPLDGQSDVQERLGLVRDILDTPACSTPHVRPVIEEVAEVFHAASEQLRRF